MAKFSVVFIFVGALNGVLWAEGIPYTTRIRRNAVKDSRHHWPKGIVFYRIDNRFNQDQRATIISAMKEIESVSCVRFKKRDTEKAFVDIIPGDNCSAGVGYKGRPRKLTLGKKCFKKKSIQHELFHSLGFYHEHARPDRDDFIHILMENIQKEHLFNFMKNSKNKVTTLGLPYDYQSIMHYGDNGFATNKGKKTILPKKNGTGIGGATKLSKIDILKINKLYPCSSLSHHHHY